MSFHFCDELFCQMYGFHVQRKSFKVSISYGSKNSLHGMEIIQPGRFVRAFIIGNCALTFETQFQLIQ